ncbi:TP53-regulated inhibitor of apoptosis 1-like isoform X2 [Chelonus insularis]|uniref:TP53-regulated inhibitor of apoptosis 1-like isoform X2 n=1 Tax=Chelonus insularis TaxID=460826 RepID=UPI00158BA9A7|nr:TP53-regulated inhibitor of apoptosis 1-like isoform X2 [Chelonus insularis]XP_034949175.1 TP53-regulated inhibitor of apoptosis 1-like isoform X2 [Chelonus insularis]
MLTMSKEQSRLHSFMNSIGESCNEIKKQYDTCFQTWFSDKFLKGDTNDSMCAPLFKVYQNCLKKAIKDHKIEIKDLEVSVLETEKEKQPPS